MKNLIKPKKRTQYQKIQFGLKLFVITVIVGLFVALILSGFDFRAY